jgi:predicted ester cyclase
MRKHRLLYALALLTCGLLAFAWAEQRPRHQASPQRPPAGNLQASSPEQNKAVVRRVFDELFSQGRYESIGQIYARECPVHTGNKLQRLDESIAEGKGWRRAAPDLRMSVDQISASGDMVHVAWTATGTHTGAGNGARPTGKRIAMRGNSDFRVVNGRIVEVWNHYDRDGLYRQVGVNPRVGELYEKLQELRLAFGRIFAGDQADSPSAQP